MEGTSILTRNVTTTRDIPNELGQSMTFRQLGWRQLAEAEEARSATVLRNLRNMGGELLRDLQTINRAEVDADAAKVQADDPLTKFDQATVLYAGLAAWTYPDKLTHENIDGLDPATARWAALEIIAMGMPPIEKDLEDRFFGSQPISTATATTALRTAVSESAPSQTNGYSA